MAFLTVSAVVSGIGGVLSNVASGAIAVIKVVASVAFAGVFAIAITTLLSALEQIIFGSVVGEVLGILSVVLPFNPATVFASINIVILSITAFLVAKKTYELVSNLISVSGH